jgi:hypothetical protein
LLFASSIRSSGVQDFSVASLGPRYLSIEATPATKPTLPARCARGAVKADKQEVLDTLAIKHDIAVKDVAYAMAYADDMLADAIYTAERELEREIEGEDPV